jgi:hypothetical protein
MKTNILRVAIVVYVKIIKGILYVNFNPFEVLLMCRLQWQYTYGIGQTVFATSVWLKKHYTNDERLLSELRVCKIFILNLKAKADGP